MSANEEKIQFHKKFSKNQVIHAFNGNKQDLRQIIGKCQYKYTRGINKNKKCGNNCFENPHYCKIHERQLRNVMFATGLDKTILGDEDNSNASYTIAKSLADFSTKNLAIKCPPFKIKKDSGSNMAIIGSSKSGKTTFAVKYLKNLLNEYDDLVIILMSPNLQSGVYDSLKKEQRVISIPNYSEEFIKLIHHIQKKTENHYNFLIILDDIIDQKYNKTVKKGFLTLRNAKISMIIILQSVHLLDKNIRASVNKVVLGKINSSESIIDAWKFLLPYKQDIFVNPLRLKVSDELKIESYRDLTIDYMFIVVDQIAEKIYLTSSKVCS